MEHYATASDSPIFMRRAPVICTQPIAIGQVKATLQRVPGFGRARDKKKRTAKAA